MKKLSCYLFYCQTLPSRYCWLVTSGEQMESGRSFLLYARVSWIGYVDCFIEIEFISWQMKIIQYLKSVKDARDPLVTGGVIGFLACVG